MFEWLKKLCGRAGKPEPAPEPEPATLPERKPTVDHLRRPKPDLVARQLGQKRNKIHIYRQPYGYPIRLCDWVAQDEKNLAVLQESGPGVHLKTYIVNRGYLDEGQVCIHCWRVLLGDRTSVGMDNHGRGKGAPIP